MDGRRFRAVVGGICVVGDMISFTISSAIGTEVTWQAVVGHSVVLLIGLLLIDPALGKDVLARVLRKTPIRRDRGG